MCKTVNKLNLLLFLKALHLLLHYSQKYSKHVIMDLDNNYMKNSKSLKLRYWSVCSSGNRHEGLRNLQEHTCKAYVTSRSRKEGLSDLQEQASKAWVNSTNRQEGPSRMQECGTTGTMAQILPWRATIWALDPLILGGVIWLGGWSEKQPQLHQWRKRWIENRQEHIQQPKEQQGITIKK